MIDLDEIKRIVSEYQCDFKKNDMAGIIVSYGTFEILRTQYLSYLKEWHNGEIYLYGLLVIRHPLCPDDKAYVINQDVVNDILWSSRFMKPKIQGEMTYAHVYKNMRIAENEFRDFLDLHEDKIAKTKRGCPHIAILNNGEEHHFMSGIVYDQWCRGRTYMIGDVLYRSGFPFKNDWN